MTTLIRTPLREQFLTPQMYREALLARNAVNYITVTQSLNRVLPHLWKEALAQEKGIEFVNKHPICRVYVGRLCSLNGLEVSNLAVEEACRECLERSQA